MSFCVELKVCGKLFLCLLLSYKSMQLVDMWYKSTDKETFTMSRKLIRDEGLLCGKFMSWIPLIGYISQVLCILLHCHVDVLSTLFHYLPVFLEAAAPAQLWQQQ